MSDQDRERGYYRVMAGRGSMHAEQCRAEGFIGADFGIDESLDGKLTEELRDFNKAMIPIFLRNRPDKSKIAAGLACGALWNVSKGIQIGDVILSPDGTGSYMVGDVTGDYHHAPGGILPHRRHVRWRDVMVLRSDMSESLKHSAGSISTVSNISDYANEIERLTGPAAPLPIPGSDDALGFGLEAHLEQFLVDNWSQTPLGAEWDLASEDGEVIGKQYQTDAGRIDLLAESKDGTRLLVIELKRGRASDEVVGQVLRYIGFIRDQIAAPHQTTEGAIIALEDDQKLRWALSAVRDVRFYRYEIKFDLHEVAIG